MATGQRASACCVVLCHLFVRAAQTQRAVGIRVEVAMQKKKKFVVASIEKCMEEGPRESRFEGEICAGERSHLCSIDAQDVWAAACFARVVAAKLIRPWRVILWVV